VIICALCADGSTITDAYDVQGNKIAETDQNGVETDYQYNQFGELTAVVEPSGGPDTHDPRDPRETRRIEIAPRGWSFSVGNLTRQVDVILLTSTVIVDMISVMNARRCFRSLTDAHIRPAPDRR